MLKKTVIVACNIHPEDVLLSAEVFTDWDERFSAETCCLTYVFVTCFIKSVTGRDASDNCQRRRCQIRGRTDGFMGDNICCNPFLQALRSVWEVKTQRSRSSGLQTSVRGFTSERVDKQNETLSPHRSALYESRLNGLTVAQSSELEKMLNWCTSCLNNVFPVILYSSLPVTKD